jgi:electron transfer flavoprotein alpha subunit
VMQALAPDKGRIGEIIKCTSEIKESDLGGRIIESKRREMKSELPEAGAIACGGAGCKTRENFEKYIVPLAGSLSTYLGEKAMVGASRAAVELGFIDHTVKPRIYIAVGVSGAVQHITGMQNSDIIVAINKDPKAPIFKAADFGVLANIEEVVPKLIEAFESGQKPGVSRG